MATAKDVQRALAAGRKRGIGSIKPRRKKKGILDRISSTSKKGRAGSTIKGYFF